MCAESWGAHAAASAGAATKGWASSPTAEGLLLERVATAARSDLVAR